MLRHVILFHIIFVQLTFGYEGGILYKTTNEIVHLGYQAKVEKCEFISNKNVTYDCIKDSSNNFSKKFRCQRSCHLEIHSVNTDDSGWWKVRAVNNSGLTAERSYYLIVQDEMITQKLLPINETSSTITTTVNSSTIFYMPKAKGKTKSCLLTQEDDLQFAIYNVLKNDTDFLQPLYDCGVRMKINEKHSGLWTLINTVDTNKMYIGKFTIKVSNEVHNPVEEITDYVLEGRNDYVIKARDSAINCELYDPAGTLKYSSAKQCKYTLKNVTHRDEGVWTLHYHLKKVHTTFTLKLNITVYVPQVESTVKFSEDNKTIHMLCSLNDHSKINFCHFKRADDKIYSVYELISNEKYEYYGNGFKSGECGMTIRNANKSDYVPWKCHMKISSSKTIGSAIRVDNSKENEVLSRHDINVKLGQSLKITCKTDEVIQYCWMKNPNGKLQIINENDEYSDIPYEGRGFSVGECGIRILNATAADKGFWKCQMKTQSKKMVEKSINVIVRDSPIKTNADNLIYNGSPITLSCNIISGDIFDIDVCWWIKPDGNGIHYESDSRYKIKRNHNNCSLNIYDTNIEGKWTCVVQTKIGKQETYQATINIIKESSNYFLIIIGSCSIVNVILAAIAFYICKRSYGKSSNTNSMEFELKKKYFS